MAPETEIVEELAQHLAQREADLVAAGIDPDEARRRVLQDVPEWPRLAADIRLADRPRPMAPAPPPLCASNPLAGIRDEVRYAIRTLLRAPGCTMGVGFEEAGVGVRMALGATRADVGRMAVGAGLTWVVRPSTSARRPSAPAR